MKGGLRSDVHVAVITGLSGAGRSEAAKAFEDLGWFVIDNLPPALIDKMLALALASGSSIQQIAFVIDSRGGTFFSEAASAIETLRATFTDVRLVFLDAPDDVLVRRFDESRRRHPMAEDDPVVVGIHRERALMQPFKDTADLVIETSSTSVRALRTKIGAYFALRDPSEGLKTSVISFGYKFGLPVDADIVLDVRFLPNPHWVDTLRPLTGLEEPVHDYVMNQDQTVDFISRVGDLFALLLPGFQNEGRHYLTVAVGCTGGRHRSVVLAEEIGRFIGDKGFPVKVIHRDVNKAAAEP